MDARNGSSKVVAVVGEKVPRLCLPCGYQLGFCESTTAVTSVAKWICPECGTLNQFEIEFRIASR